MAASSRPICQNLLPVTFAENKSGFKSAAPVATAIPITNRQITLGRQLDNILRGFVCSGSICTAPKGPVFLTDSFDAALGRLT